jgi:putative acetyltransferase
VNDLLLRPETAKDIGAIFDVVARAFGNRVAEPKLVDLIRERGNARLATVAEEGGELVGYLLASPLTLDPPSPLKCLAIGPVAVIPERQRDGIGSRLMRHAIELARDGGVDALFLLGHPSYYPRFGFAATHVGNEYGATDAFMALELREGCLAGVRATARYVTEFAEVGA